MPKKLIEQLEIDTRGAELALDPHDHVLRRLISMADFVVSTASELTVLADKPQLVECAFVSDATLSVNARLQRPVIKGEKLNFPYHVQDLKLQCIDGMGAVSIGITNAHRDVKFVQRNDPFSEYVLDIFTRLYEPSPTQVITPVEELTK